MVKVLELFSGTRSIGKVCDQLGWESVSVDLIMEADHKVNIMDFDYKQYDKDFMNDIPFYDVDYCKYNNHPIRKRTRIWTNKKDWNNLLCKKDCGSIIDNKHLSFRYMNIKGVNRLHLRYRIPEDLIFSLFLD
mgnify:CR=1 FL=1